MGTLITYTIVHCSARNYIKGKIKDREVRKNRYNWNREKIA
jgi:hypothetical protein